MQTINFNDTLNDQNVSIYVSSQEEAQSFIDQMYAKHKKYSMEASKGEYAADKGETTRQLLSSQITLLQNNISNLDEVLATQSDGPLKDKTQLERDKAFVKVRELLIRYEAKCGYGYIENSFETAIEIAFKHELIESIKVVVDYANLQGWTVNDYELFTATVTV
ncbi:hypothetical protein [Flammeovirga kamogawensis]|uniref:Uncharacterized protein n=1 Tax=Flammeovirga kamogawensis TaxID=373891 RepID=A0ABX8H052_9BACT|nr:hypothetical protein [Flammeovirga kamogawensis]MBB6463639.1 hypothetical protein [Flammeovirga kamogawensis]QWG09253.1 hypothetical protein KM029_21855 [Flammeovirga kamogawensis]TRX64778.1 hypothetical protein EO216_19765 [Flammeovirga kamogawensis]